MELDRRTIKVLSSDTRVEIMKSLTERRKMPSELSKEFDMAASTIVEHLRQLESAGLVERRATGRKWIYYELTRHGMNLVRPKFQVQFNVLLALGLMFIFASTMFFADTLAPTQFLQGRITETSDLSAPSEKISVHQAPSTGYAPLVTSVGNWLWLITLFIGMALLMVALVVRYDIPLWR